MVTENLGLTLNDDPNEINERVADSLHSLAVSGTHVPHYTSLILGTSFDKKIISEAGIVWAKGRLERIEMVMDALNKHKRLVDDALMVLHEYAKKVLVRKKDGVTRLTNDESSRP